MNRDSFIVYIKTKDIYVDIAKDFEWRFGTSNCELERPLPREKNKGLGLMKDELYIKIFLLVCSVFII